MGYQLRSVDSIGNLFSIITALDLSPHAIGFSPLVGIFVGASLAPRAVSRQRFDFVLRSPRQKPDRPGTAGKLVFQPRSQSTKKYYKNILHRATSVLVSTSAFVFDGGVTLANH